MLQIWCPKHVKIAKINLKKKKNFMLDNIIHFVVKYKNGFTAKTTSF